MARLDRQLPLLGNELQNKLRNVRAAIFGVGGLGSFVSTLLACLGVGELILVDRDKVAISDLNRQILYTILDVGRYKCIPAVKRLREFAPDVQVEGVVLDVRARSGVERVVEKVSIVFNCLDNPEARLIINDVCVRYRKIMIYGGVEDLRGVIMSYVPDVSPCLRCVFRFGGTRRINVIAPTCAVVAAFQVMELIKILENNYDPVLTYVDLREHVVTTYKLERPTTCDTCQIVH